jgi:hypothetical protein
MKHSTKEIGYEGMDNVKHYYRGILHNHSIYSREGCYSLDVLRQRWASQMEFAAMTEHAEKITAEDFAVYIQECEALSDDQFRFIPGLEVATTSGDILLLGCRTYICTTDPFQVLKEAGDCLILLAHPEENRMLPAVLEHVDGFEGWNTKRMGSFMPPFDWLNRWKHMLHPNQIITGGNDIHTVDFKRKVITLVQSPSNNECDILAAVKQGHFSTSNGIFLLSSQARFFYGCYIIGEHEWIKAVAKSYRFILRSIEHGLHLGGALLRGSGLGKQMQLRASRFVRQHL